MTASLLPPNATPQERAVEGATARLAAVPVPVDTLWSPERCPAALLPWLAWSLSVDSWEADWPEHVKREVCAASFRVHQRKGTVASVREALAAAGFDDVQIIERLHRRRYNAEITHNGHFFRGDATKWATYRIVLNKPITNKQADQVRRILAAVAPVRSHLLSIDYVAVANVHNGAIRYDGTFNHGVA